MADGRLQGGDWALLGFYYQMIMLLGLGTLNNELLQAADDDTRLLVKTFTANEEHTVCFEDAGQDISIIAGGKRLLCQAKHSSNPETTFDPSSFREILASFASSLEYVNKQGGPAVCGCILLTNRIPHKAVALIKIIVQQCRDALRWKANQVNQLPAKSSAYANLSVNFEKRGKLHNQPLKSLVEHWLTDYHRNGKVKKAHDEELVEQALRILPGLYFVTEAYQHDFEQTFINFAKRYGALDHEIVNAKNQLIGLLMGGIKIKNLLTKNDFIMAVANHRDARELTPKVSSGIGEACIKEWVQWCDARDAGLDWIVSRPDIQSQFEGALMEGKRIILLLGEGGCGKTELLTQLTEPKIERLRSGSNFDGFVVLESCPEVKLHWLEQALGRWTNKYTTSEPELSNPYVRLSIANPNVKHLLWIGLDGLDEHFPHEDVLGNMIQHVRSRPNKDTCLLITSRDRYARVGRQIDKWRRSSSAEPGIDVAIIEVGELQEEEVREVVRNGIGLDITDYLLVAYVSPRSTFETRSSSDFAGNDFIASLKHPRLLGAFVHVGQSDLEIAKAALNGDSSARNKVAHDFIGQFLDKYDHRRQQKDLPFQEDFAALLCNVALQTLNIDIALTENDWRNTALQSRIVTEHKASQLFLEAASGGLISIMDERAFNSEWKWKHPFVAVYLASTNYRTILP